ncbi:MAG: HlyC/CorC family transporter [Gemmatimonadales bacterium]|nr:HlyC/CorC family transporter [Gemmatimonadales bacterium]
MAIALLVGLILLNGLFAMSEIALVTARKARLTKLAGAGDGAAQVALRLGEDPTRFLSTIQIGITSIGILNGIVGEAVFAGPFALWLSSVGLNEAAASILATGLVVIVITYVSIVIGELVPKRLGQLSPESVARLVARPMLLLAKLTRPFVHLLSFSTNTILRLMGVRNSTSASITEEEIHAFLAEGSEAGVIEREEHEMVRNLFRLDDRKLGSLMVPRADIVYLDTKAPITENMARVADSVHSRFPVCDGDLDNLVGVVTAKQILAQTLKGETPDIQTGLLTPAFVPETLTGLELLESFRTNHMSAAFVLDEYGGIKGLVTLQDLLEAVTGELSTPGGGDAWALQREDGSWLLDGTIPIPELKDRLGIRQLPEEDAGRYHTVSGMMMLLLGRVGATGDRVQWDNWTFEIVDMDEKRIDKVLASRVGG